MNNKNALKKRLDRMHEKMAKLKADIKKAEEEYQAAEDAETLKIIRKTSLTPEQLKFFNGVSKEEIEMILKKREGEKEIVRKDNEKE